MRMTLIYNPRAGQVLVRRQLEHIVDYLRGYGNLVEVLETGCPGNATGLARRAAECRAEMVVAVGGDGTVSEVAGGLVGTDVVMGVLPVGTTNVWALQVGIPVLDPFNPGARIGKFVAGLSEQFNGALPFDPVQNVLLDAARVLVEGRTVSVDVGEVAGRHFLLWAGIGLDAAVTQSISLQEKRAIGAWAFIIPALDKFRNFAGAEVRLTLDGRTVLVETPLVVISNIQLYGAILPLGAKACVTDGLLDVCVFKGEGLLTFVHHALQVLSRRHLQDPEIEYYQCRHLVVESARPLPVHADDEPFTETPVTVRVLPRSLRVIVPQSAPEELFNPRSASAAN